MIVPTLCVGMPHWTLCVRFGSDAERHGLHSHAGAWERSESDSPAKTDEQSTRSLTVRRGSIKCGSFPRSAWECLIGRSGSASAVTRSVTGCIPTRERGNDQSQTRPRKRTSSWRDLWPPVAAALSMDRSHALRGNASLDALRPLRQWRGASWAAFPRGSVGTIRVRLAREDGRAVDEISDRPSRQH